MRIVCGTDIIEIDRIKKAIENLGDKFLNEIFTEKEIKYCESKNKQKFQHYAARFAAKEAAFKACSFAFEKYSCDWHTFEMINDENGRPILIIHSDNDIGQFDISVSHCKEYAVATVTGLVE